MRSRFVLLLPVVLAAAACTDGTSPPPPLKHGFGPSFGVFAVAVSPSSLELAVGDTSRIRVSVSAWADSLPGLAITWKTGDSTIAVVSSEGLVTARGAGSAAITATATFPGSTASGSATVTVRAP